VRSGDFEMNTINLIAIIVAIRACQTLALEGLQQTVNMSIIEEYFLTMSFMKFGCSHILKLIL